MTNKTYGSTMWLQNEMPDDVIEIAKEAAANSLIFKAETEGYRLNKANIKHRIEKNFNFETGIETTLMFTWGTVI